MTKDFKQLTDFLVGMGVEQVPHTHKSYLAHLIAVYRLLEAQGCPEAVCRAGLFHSIYGTERFQGFTLPLARRGEVRALIGNRAEYLAELAAQAARGPRLTSGRLGVRMFGAGRRRGVVRRLLEPVLQLLDPGEQRADDGLRLRRLAGDQFFRDLQWDALHVGEKPARGQAGSLSASSRPVLDCPLRHRGARAMDGLGAWGAQLSAREAA
jgi:hypothetical protein